MTALQCPACHSRLTLPDNFVSTNFRCPRCRAEIAAPQMVHPADDRITDARPAMPLADSHIVRCPFCAEPVNPDAIKCKHCGESIDQSEWAREKLRRRGDEVDVRSTQPGKVQAVGIMMLIGGIWRVLVG